MQPSQQVFRESIVRNQQLKTLLRLIWARFYEPTWDLKLFYKKLTMLGGRVTPEGACRISALRERRHVLANSFNPT